MGITRVKDPFRPKTNGRVRYGDGPVPKQLRNTNNGKNPDKLSDQEQLWVKEYVASFNIQQSTLNAGYKNQNYGYELIRKPKIQLAIRREMEARNDRLEITQERVLLEVARLAFGNLSDFFDNWGKGERLVVKSKESISEDAQRAMSSISETIRGNTRTLKFQTHSKQAALKMLGDYMGMWDGSGRQADPDDLVAQLRAAAANAEASLPDYDNDEGAK